MDLENANTISSDLIRGHINTIILNILYENDRYGYEIIQQIELKSNGQYSLKQPTLYSALKRLEQLNFVTSYWGTGMSNGGRRKYFQITDKGREFVQQNRAEWEYSRTIIDNLVSNKIFDFNKNTPPSNIDFSALKKSIPKQEKIMENAKLSPSIHNNQMESKPIENPTPLESSSTPDNQPIHNSIETKIDNNHLATATFAWTTIENDTFTENSIKQSTPTIENNTNNATAKTNTNPILDVIEQTQNENTLHSIEEEEQQKSESQTIYSILEDIVTSSSPVEEERTHVVENIADDATENLIDVIKNADDSLEVQKETNALELQLEEINEEHTKKMHENYLKLIGDYDALQTHYIYTLLENENPAFSAMQTKSFYTDKGIELDYYSTFNFDEIPYTSDTIWASSLKDDTIYAQESPNIDQMQENLLEQLPVDILQQNNQIEEEVVIQVQDKYSDIHTANFLYTNLQDETNQTYTNNLQETDLIYNLLDENSTNKKSSSKTKKIIKNWFVNTSYSKLFIVLSSIILVIALVESLTIFFIGRKYNISYQFALSVAILYTITYILSTVFATRKNSYDALVTIGQKKYMWYFLLFYFIALIISIISLYLLTKTFQNTVEIDFWFYSISFNLLTFNLPLFSIIYCCIVTFKQNNKKDTP